LAFFAHGRCIKFPQRIAAPMNDETQAHGGAMQKFTPKFTLNLERTFGPALGDGIPRVAAEGYFHVVLSGNRRKVLFSTVDDRRAINQIAIDVLERFAATLHAYCLMPNHFRALVQIDERLLIKALRRIATRYSRHRQRHQKSTLHLFERPYTAQRVDTDGEFLNLLRHIHLAPVIANKVIAPDDYLWSSHRAYLGYKSVARITTDFGLSLLAPDTVHARVAYHQFIAEGLAENVQRAVARRAPSVRMTAHTVADASPSEIVCPTSISTASTGTALIESRTPLPTRSQATLPRFGRNPKRWSSRRFMSVY
jgi:REP element-mobilizing transposase RayT